MKTLRRPNPCILPLVALLATAACDESTEPVALHPLVLAPVQDDLPRTPQRITLSDFEQSTLSFRLADVDGRFEQQPATATLAVESGGANNTDQALHLTANETSQIRAVLAPATTTLVVNHDYSSCKTLTFWVKQGATGAGTSVSLLVESVNGKSQVPVTVTTEWAQITVDLATLTGAAPGTAAPVDIKQTTALALESVGGANLWLDQMTLTDCVVPNLNPPIPEPIPLGSAPPGGTAAPAGSPVALHGQLRVEGTQIVDQSGQPVQLRGMSTMWLNMGGGRYGINQANLLWMRDNWNLSVIRAAMGVEGSGGYLSSSKSAQQAVEAIIKNAIAAGVYVIVDWHFHNEEKDPGVRHRQANAFFDAIASQYGSAPNIIYETFNEPLKVSWSNELKPYHTVVVETIRAKDPDNLIVLGTSQWSQKVEEAAADPLGGANLLYTLHFYSCTHKEWLRTNGDLALSKGLPLFVTEWGGTAADGGTSGALCEADTQTWLDWVNKHQLSGAAWKLDACSDLSCILTPGAPEAGPWPDLHGHGPAVREWIKG